MDTRLNHPRLLCGDLGALPLDLGNIQFGLLQLLCQLGVSSDRILQSPLRLRRVQARKMQPGRQVSTRRRGGTSLMLKFCTQLREAALCLLCCLAQTIHLNASAFKV